MAVGGAAATTSLDLFECQVCLEPMVERQPRTLSACNHTFCQFCLERLVDRQKKSIVCPTCRKLTKVPKGNVEELPRNFNLAKMKEWQEDVIKEAKLTDHQEEATEAEPCDVCSHEGSSKNAVCKCDECSISLCNTCKDIHLSTPACTSHQIIFFGSEPFISPEKCATHGKPILFICFECHIEMCSVCSFSNIHQLHKESILSLEEGLQKIKESAQHQNQLLKKDTEKLNQILQNSKGDMKAIDAALQDLLYKVENIKGKHRQPLLMIIEKLELAKERYGKILREINNRQPLDYFRNEGKILKDIEETRALLLGVRTEYDHVPKLQKISADEANKTLDAQQNCSLCKAIAVPDKHSPALTKNVAMVHQSLASARLVLRVKRGVTFIGLPYRILHLKNNNAIVEDKHVGFLQQIDMNGHLVSQIYPHGISNTINGTCVFGNKLYFSNMSGITQVPLNFSQEGRCKCSAFKNVSTLAAICERKLLVCTYGGDMFELDHKTGSKTLLLSGLNSPGYICVKQITNGYKYFVSECDYNGRILTNTEDGDGCKVLMDGLNVPAAICLTPNDTLLVAEDCGNRVFEMTLEGVFIRAVLTERQHKIRRPHGISLRYPYLWLCEAEPNDPNGGAIKLFKFT